MKTTTFALPLSFALVLFAAGASAQSGNPARGERLFNQQCKACHTLEKGGASTMGPDPHGVIGRKAGTAEGFKNYSPAMKKQDIVWTGDNLDKYLTDPKGFVPGNRMIFVGLKKAEDRANVIAYIKQQSEQQ